MEETIASYVVAAVEGDDDRRASQPTGQQAEWYDRQVFTLVNMDDVSMPGRLRDEGEAPPRCTIVAVVGGGGPADESRCCQSSRGQVRPA